MKVSLKQIDRSRESLDKLIKNKLPLLVAYRVGKFSKQAMDSLQIYNEKRNKLLSELGKQRLDDKGEPVLENGQTIFELGDNVKQFNDEVNKAYDEEVTIDISPTSLKELEGYDLEPVIFRDLDFLFTE